MPTRSAESALWLCAAFLLLSACSGPPTDPVLVSVAVDLSDPTRETLLRHADLAYRFQKRLPEGSGLRVCVFAHRLEPVYVGPPLRTREAFNRALGPSLSRPSANVSRPGTRTDLALERLASDAAGTRLPALLLIVTDGGVEDRGSEPAARFEASMSSLAERSAPTRLLVAGVEARHREWWETLLGPLGSRARVRGVADAIPAMEEASR